MMKPLFLTAIWLLFQTPMFVVGVDDLLQNKLKLRGSTSTTNNGRQLMDPKTVEVKQQVHQHQQLVHQQQEQQKQQQEQQDHSDFSNLRFLFFGTSRTWGAGLDDRLNQAFPFLMHSNSTNLGIRSSHSPYARSCAASMLKDDNEAFDVIVLEFAAFHFKFTLQLAQRLRKRYPHSVIFFYEMWLPLNFVHTPSGQNLRTWGREHQVSQAQTQARPGESINIIDPNVPLLLKALTHPNDWTFQPVDVYKEGQVQQMMMDSSAFLLRIPRPENIHDALAKYSHNYLPDMNHYSVAGHRFVADAIYQNLRDHGMRTVHDSTMGAWDTVDHCEKWMETGITNMQHSPNIVMKEFGNAGKYALETTRTTSSSDSTTSTSWIKVVNTRNAPSELWLDHMATSPDCLYQQPVVVLHTVGPATDGQDQNTEESSVTLECKKLGYNYPVHVAVQTRVGVVPPGESVVKIITQRQQGPPPAGQQHAVVLGAGAAGAAPSNGDLWPFRITGILLIEPMGAEAPGRME